MKSSNTRFSNKEESEETLVRKVVKNNFEDERT